MRFLQPHANFLIIVCLQKKSSTTSVMRTMTMSLCHLVPNISPKRIYKRNEITAKKHPQFYFIDTIFLYVYSQQQQPERAVCCYFISYKKCIDLFRSMYEKKCIILNTSRELMKISVLTEVTFVNDKALFSISFENVCASRLLVCHICA